MGQDFRLTNIKGLYEVFTPTFRDFRGEYWPLYEQGKFERTIGRNSYFEWKQDGISTARKGVFRGFHGDANTTKLTTCLAGEVFSVIIDMRPESETYLGHDTFILSSAARNQLLIPPGCGNSYYALTDDVVYMYKQDTHYGDQLQFTVRWNDPAFQSVLWPFITPLILSPRDTQVKDLHDRGLDPYK